MFLHFFLIVCPFLLSLTRFCLSLLISYLNYFALQGVQQPMGRLL